MSILLNVFMLVNASDYQRACAIRIIARNVCHEAFPRFKICEDLEWAKALADFTRMKDGRILPEMRELYCGEGGELFAKIVSDLEYPPAEHKNRKIGVYFF